MPNEKESSGGNVDRQEEVLREIVRDEIRSYLTVLLCRHLWGSYNLAIPGELGAGSESGSTAGLSDDELSLLGALAIVMTEMVAGHERGMLAIKSHAPELYSAICRRHVTGGKLPPERRGDAPSAN